MSSPEADDGDGRGGHDPRMPFNVGPGELIVVLVIALLVLGPKRLPDAGRALGSGLRNFKRGLVEEPPPPSEEPAPIDSPRRDRSS
jgi:sec-independent protein translocase protein TatA